MFLKVSQFFFYHILVAQSLESKTFICHEEKGLSIINIGFIYMWVLYENRSFCSCASSPLMYIHDAALLDTMWCCFCLNQIHDTNQSWVLMIGENTVLENIMGTGENAGFLHFFSFSGDVLLFFLRQV